MQSKKDWREQERKIEKRHGVWFSYDINKKGKKFFLTDCKNHSIETSIRYFEKVVNFAEDLLKIPLSKARVLDLGCMEGVASFAFGPNVKNVLGIEGRRSNITRACFTKSLLGLKNIEFKEDDIRNIILPTKSFDVVLALGVLYHFNVHDLFKIIENLYKWTKEITIIDTHIAFLPKVKQTYKGQAYYGVYYDEFIPNETSESSIGNKKSFWLTRSSLFRILKSVGYTEIYECKIPRFSSLRQMDDRLTLVATKTSRRTASLFRLDNKDKLGAFVEHDPRVIAVQYVNLKAIQEPGDFFK